MHCPSDRLTHLYDVCAIGSGFRTVPPHAGWPSAKNVAMQDLTPSTCKAGLTDVLVAQIAANRGCTHAVSFDKGAVRHAGMTLLA